MRALRANHRVGRKAASYKVGVGARLARDQQTQDTDNRAQDALLQGKAEPAPVIAVDDKSIAVLPFEDMSQEKNQEYMSDGIAEELLNLLPALKRFSVKIISLIGNLKSSLAKHSDIALNLKVPKEACPFNLAPTSSTTATLTSTHPHANASPIRA